ncbi:MAG: transcription termination factor NusA [Lachnospiraceae bacterium]|nr:transcription termination factor NusA [Lachnospiraceae bacterium]
MNQEIFDELTNYLNKKRNISKETLLEAIRQSIVQACKNHYGKTDVSNVIVNINENTNVFEVYAEKTVVEKVEDELTQISLTNARLMDGRYELGDVVRVEIKSKEFGRIATQNAKNVILQKIREEERKSIFQEYQEKERDIVTGKVEWNVGKNISVNIGRTDAILTTEEMIPGERFRANQKIKLYITEVKDTPKGPKILVSRRHPELVKRLFEAQVTEVHDGIVEIKSIAREAGVRTKIAVWSNNPDVDPVGACVGVGGARVNEVVKELGGEKIDVIQWDENPAYFIENSLSPSEVIYVAADADEKTATVVVPDSQLSLAIGKEGLNAKLAARLTGFVAIDIKSETVAIESGILPEYPEDDEYEEDYAGEMDQEDLPYDGAETFDADPEGTEAVPEYDPAKENADPEQPMFDPEA